MIIVRDTPNMAAGAIKVRIRLNREKYLTNK